MSSNRETIGHVDCDECGKRVPVKLRSDGTSDYYCKCTAVRIFSINQTAKFAAVQAEPTPEPTPEPEPEADDRPTPDQPAERNPFAFWEIGS